MYRVLRAYVSFWQGWSCVHCMNECNGSIKRLKRRSLKRDITQHGPWTSNITKLNHPSSSCHKSLLGWFYACTTIQGSQCPSPSGPWHVILLFSITIHTQHSIKAFQVWRISAVPTEIGCCNGPPESGTVSVLRSRFENRMDFCQESLVRVIHMIGIPSTG